MQEDLKVITLTTFHSSEPSPPVHVNTASSRRPPSSM